MRRVVYALLALLATTALAACATGPGFDTAGTDEDLQPTAAARDEVRDVDVIWGGQIIAVKPREEDTQIELLAYPLDRSQRPRTDSSSQGRILVIADGYLEPADYAEGRLVTARGTLDGVQTGRIGEAEYRYPVLRAERVHLWPRQDQAGSRQRSGVSFGVGIGIIR